MMLAELSQQIKSTVLSEDGRWCRPSRSFEEESQQWKYVKPNIKVVDLVFQIEKMLLLVIDS
jgi:hypothetical protein